MKPLPPSHPYAASELREHETHLEGDESTVDGLLSMAETFMDDTNSQCATLAASCRTVLPRVTHGFMGSILSQTLARQTVNRLPDTVPAIHCYPLLVV